MYPRNLPENFSARTDCFACVHTFKITNRKKYVFNFQLCTSSYRQWWKYYEQGHRQIWSALKCSQHFAARDSFMNCLWFQSNQTIWILSTQLINYLHVGIFDFDFFFCENWNSHVKYSKNMVEWNKVFNDSYRFVKFLWLNLTIYSQVQAFIIDIPFKSLKLFRFCLLESAVEINKSRFFKDFTWNESDELPSHILWVLEIGKTAVVTFFVCICFHVWRRL